MAITLSLSVPLSVMEEAAKKKKETGQSLRKTLTDYITAEPTMDPTLTLTDILQSAVTPNPLRSARNSNIELSDEEHEELKKRVEVSGLTLPQFAWKQFIKEDPRLLTEKTTLPKKVERVIFLLNTNQIK